MVRIETCYFNEKGKLQIASGEDVYPIILKSCYKTHIGRDLEKEENENKDESLKE